MRYLKVSSLFSFFFASLLHANRYTNLSRLYMCTQIGTLFKARILSCTASRPLKSDHFSRLISASLLNTLLLTIFSLIPTLHVSDIHMYSPTSICRRQKKRTIKNHKGFQCYMQRATETSVCVHGLLWARIYPDVVELICQSERKAHENASWYLWPLLSLKLDFFDEIDFWPIVVFFGGATRVFNWKSSSSSSSLINFNQIFWKMSLPYTNTKVQIHNYNVPA